MIHLLWIVPLSMFGGFQIGSIVEKLKNYNFADLEYDILKTLEGKISADEKAVINKALGIVRKAEFWKKKV